jgi:peptidoglycan/xylan/chitin deacetylase (PgdA/CDA1 family)
MAAAQRSLAKTAPELRAWLKGRMPAFARGGVLHPGEVPVFVFHDVRPEPLEAQLAFIARNGYRTLDAGELVQAIRNPDPARRAVVLTFDDATWTFWAFAFPLLERHSLRAILFAVPGLVPDDPTPYPNLLDVEAGRASLEDLERRAQLQPLCTWRELEIIRASGLVDIQSHSLTHALVPIGPKVVDFVHPGLDPGRFANADLPLSATDDPERPSRRLRPGAPVFRSASRLSGRRRYLEDPSLTNALTSYVEADGGPAYFSRPGWRRRLRAQAGALLALRPGQFETQEETDAAMRLELERSKVMLEERLPGQKVEHFCYPWFEGGRLADRLAAEAGYRSVHYGPHMASPEETDGLMRVRRVSEEYLMCLPGEGRQGAGALWARRLAGFARGGSAAA